MSGNKDERKFLGEKRIIPLGSKEKKSARDHSKENYQEKSREIIGKRDTRRRVLEGVDRDEKSKA